MASNGAVVSAARALLDADVPPAIGDALRQLGHDAVPASGNPALETLNDADLLREATRQGRVLVTFNIVDFTEAARAFAHSEEGHSGIILIHSHTYPRTNIGAIARALDATLQSPRDVTNSVYYLR